MNQEPWYNDFNSPFGKFVKILFIPIAIFMFFFIQKASEDNMKALQDMGCVVISNGEAVVLKDKPGCDASKW